MITNKVFYSAQALQEQLSGQGHRLAAVAGTPLADLVDVTLSPKAYAMATTPEAPMPRDMLVQDSARKNLNGEVEHDAAMAELVELASDAIRGNLHLARNVVVPAVKAVHEKYQERIDAMDVDAKQPVAIVPNIYHELWSNPQFHGLVERFENVPMNEVKSTIALPRLTGAELEPMLKTGISSLDEMIWAWYEDMPVDKLTEAYEKVFVTGTAPLGRPTNAVHRTPVGDLDRNDLVMAFLIASNFEEHLPDGVTASLQQLRLMLARMREQAGRAVASELARRERDNRQKVMIYSTQRVEWAYTDEGRRLVFVNNDVYLRYLEEGGTPESIFGAVVSADRTDYQALIDNRDVNERRWAKHAALHAQKVGAKIYTSQREALRLAMADYINGLPDEELDIERAQLHQWTVNLLGRCQPKEFDDPLCVARRLVCDVLYGHTNARMVLDAMEVAENENPEMNARECALLSVIDLVARWMASQIQITYAK